MNDNSISTKTNAGNKNAIRICAKGKSGQLELNSETTKMGEAKNMMSEKSKFNPQNNSAETS